MPRGEPFDVDAFHRLLWAEADRQHRIRIKQVTLAESLGITPFTMSRVMSDMVAKGRLRHIGAQKTNQGAFVVADPDVWALTQPDEELKW